MRPSGVSGLWHGVIDAKGNVVADHEHAGARRDPSAPLRIALVLDRFDPLRGGLERWTYDLATWLVARGDAVHVVAFEIAPAADEIGVVVHRLAPATTALARGQAAAEYLRTLDVDVVHDLGTTWDADLFHPQFGSRIADLRASLETASPTRQLRMRFGWSQRARDWEKRALETRQCATARVLIAPSAMVRDHFVGLNGVDPTRIAVIHNGVDVARFTTAGRSERRAVARRRLGLGDEVVFLLAAHNLRLKGAATAIRALATIARAAPRVLLLVIGRADASEFVRLASRCGVGDRLRFLGFADDPTELYAAADVYLHPTFYDPCSLTVLEAWASGIPAITTRRNGAAELMTDGEHGFAVDDPRDVRAVAGAMARLLDDDARLRMGAASRLLAERQSSVRQFERIVELYRAQAGARVAAARRA